jgi:hypothetical protein
MIILRLRWRLHNHRNRRRRLPATRIISTSLVKPRRKRIFESRRGNSANNVDRRDRDGDGIAYEEPE